MAEKVLVLLPDPELLGGPVELIDHTFGNDVLAKRFRENEDLIVFDLLSPGSQGVALRELFDFNGDNSLPRPAIRVPTQVRLFDPNVGSYDPALFSLVLSEGTPRAVGMFELRRIIPFKRPTPEADLRVAAAAGELLAVVEQGSAADFETFLASLQLEREAALARLRHLAEVHRDAVQNAVDILQTKRIDFLENPQEAGIEGSIMAFVVAQAAGGLLGVVLGNVFELVATGVFSVVGRWQRRQAAETISAFIKQRRQEIRATVLSLRKVQRKFVPEKQRGALKSKMRLRNMFQERIGALKKDVSRAEMERKLLLEGLLEDSMARAQALRARLDEPLTRPGGRPDIVNKAGGVLIDNAAAEAVSEAVVGVTQTTADSGVRMSALPLDVAMKMEVQDYFDPWLKAVEESMLLLGQARLNVANVGTLPDDAIDEIIALVELGGALDDFIEHVSSLTDGSADLRAELTSSYELLLWLIMYRPRLSKMPTVGSPGRDWPRSELPVNRQGELQQPQPALPIGDKGTMNLLKYLALRFFGMGKIKGEGADAELVISNEELTTVYKKTEEMCAKLFAPQPAQSAAEGSGVETVSRILKTIRFVVMPYE